MERLRGSLTRFKDEQSVSPLCNVSCNVSSSDVSDLYRFRNVPKTWLGGLGVFGVPV